MLVVCSAGAELRSVTVPIAGVEASVVRGIDPDAGFRSVRVESGAAGATRLDAAAWESAVALGRRAVAHQIAGASRAMLDLACAHAMERVQFGRPIARFQAVRHRLADALVAVEALEASLAAAGDEPNADTAALAKAVAGRTARTRRRALPAGARRHRLHDRPSLPSLPEADPGARRPVRVGRRDRRASSDGSCSRRGACRRSSSCDGRGAVSDLDEPDFFRDDSLLNDPYPYFDHLRRRCPVQREPHHGVFLVTGYDEAIAVYRDTATFSSCNSVSGPFPGFPVPLEGQDVAALIEKHRDQLPMSDQLPTLDPPKHTAHRALLRRLLTPRRLEQNEAFMWRLADRQIDEFLAGGGCEFLSEFASPFALLVIADLLGVPEEDHARFRAQLASPRRGRAIGSTGPDALAHNPLEFLYQQFTRYIEERRRAPRNDVLTGLATAKFPDGSTPEVIDVVRVAANLFAAGQETSVRLLAAALRLIGERPDLQKLLRDERDRIPNFIEETLRFESPIKGDFRLSRVPTRIGGVDIAAGATVMVINGAANRDPRRFEVPGELLVDRANARDHIAFGHGIHSCPGAPLARAEARVSVERLLDRMADIRISEAAHGPASARRFEYAPTYILRGLRSLRLEFTPVG